jgi:hypothetical protein
LLLLNNLKGYLYYFQTALSKLPDVERTVYRGINLRGVPLIKENYKLRRPIHFSAYSSASTKLSMNILLSSISVI